MPEPIAAAPPPSPAEATSVETTAPVTAAPTAPTAPAPTVDPKIRSLAIRERKAIQAAEALKKEREALAAELGEAKAYRAAKEQSKKDPNTLLRSIYGDNWKTTLTEFILNGEKLTPELVSAQVDERVAQMEAKMQAERESAAAEQQKQTLAKFHSDVSEYINTNAEAYELTHLYGAEKQVSATIQAHYAETGKMLSFKEAADKVENILEERALASKKLKLKMAPPPPPPEPEKTAEKKVAPAISRAPARPTISNAMSGSSTAPLAPPKTEHEAMERALAKLRAARGV